MNDDESIDQNDNEIWNYFGEKKKKRKKWIWIRPILILHLSISERWMFTEPAGHACTHTVGWVSGQAHAHELVPLVALPCLAWLCVCHHHHHHESLISLLPIKHPSQSCSSSTTPQIRIDQDESILLNKCYCNRYMQ